MLTKISRFVLLFLWSLQVFAQEGDLFGTIHVVVNPSGRQRDPIAIYMEPCSKQLKAKCIRVEDLLRHDMEISGVFKVLSKKSFIVDLKSETLENTNWKAWFAVGAKYLIKGRVFSSGKTLGVQLKLFDCVNHRVLKVKWNPGKDLSRREALYRAVTSFADGVLEAVTGSRGLFDSKILYSVKLAGFERIIGSVHMDGTHKRTLISNGSSNMFPTFGPKGKVLYTSFLPDRPALYIGRRLLTKDNYHYRSADYCPKRNLIVAAVDMGSGQTDLVLLNPSSGKVIKNLTRSAADEISPSWSPDCSKIAYVSNRTGTLQIYVMDATGHHKRRLTMLGSYNYGPDFGKNGVIVFTGMDNFVYDIFTVDLEGNIKRITQNQGSNKDPAWSPDYRYLVFVSNRKGGWNLYVSTPDGRYQFPVTHDGARYATPAWRR